MKIIEVDGAYQGVVFRDDVVVVFGNDTITAYSSVDDVPGRVVQTFDDAGVAHLLANLTQDYCESIAIDFREPNHVYVWEEREKFAALFARRDLKPIPVIEALKEAVNGRH